MQPKQKQSATAPVRWMQKQKVHKDPHNKTTPGRRQLKRLSTFDERGSKIDRNSVFNCHLSSVWRQMAIKNTVSIDFLSTFLDSIGVFDCRLPGVKTWTKHKSLSYNWSYKQATNYRTTASEWTTASQQSGNIPLTGKTPDPDCQPSNRSPNMLYMPLQRNSEMPTTNKQLYCLHGWKF